ncbi:hypothetical protein PMAA_055820 [Talaromyces marneffei ATCC 18224]|uniref:Uncharacterized protein n=2 Tax=Talaromyces marneffei TaxID=37727 RepID=B6QL11_TALMQ|nr:hypothetical protein PMAA_055820 [Talaromyces marneffei ATCC 18224]
MTPMEPGQSFEAGMIVIPGTTKLKRVEENRASREIEFAQEEFQEMRRIIDMIRSRLGMDIDLLVKPWLDIRLDHFEVMHM